MQNPSAIVNQHQLREAFPWDNTLRCLLRDGDGIFGEDFSQQGQVLARAEGAGRTTRAAAAGLHRTADQYDLR
jgi:hypothetical protein